MSVPAKLTTVAHSALACVGVVAAITLFVAPAGAGVCAAVALDGNATAIDANPLAAPDEPDAATDAATDAVIDPLEQRVQAGRHWRLDTARGAVHVWIPAGYDAATAATVVFVHGYWVTVDEAWESYRLAQQFALSGINAMFIAPEAPKAKWKPLAWPSLAELLHTVTGQLEVDMPTKRLVAVGHSGAYRTLAAWLANTTLDTVVLLDTVYGDYGLAPWVRLSSEHRLVNISYETGRYSNELHRQLPSTQRVRGLPRTGLPEARILYVRTDVGHWQLVTEGVAVPLALRAIGVPQVASASIELPLGLPPRCDPPSRLGWLARSPFAAHSIELAP